MVFEQLRKLAKGLARRPALIAALAVAAGILAARDLTVPGWLFLACSGLVGTVALLTRGGWLSELSLVLSLVLASAFWAESRQSALLRDPILVPANRGRKIWLCGEVLEEPRIRSDGRRAFVLRVCGFLDSDNNVKKSRARVQIHVARWVRTPVHCGDRLAVWGRFLVPRGPHNPGDFDYRAYLLARGLVGTLYVGRGEQLHRLTGPRHWSVRTTVVAPVHRFVLQKLYTALPGPEAGLLQGLLLGRKELLDPQVRRAFAELGVVHVLAVSGLHVGYILLLLTLVLGMFRVPWRWRWPGVLLGVVLYAYLTGLKPPVVRAGLMAVVFLLAESFQRRYDLLNGLGLAALLVLIWQPQQVEQLGFLLSFAAVGSIALFYKRFRELLARVVPPAGPWRWLLDLTAVSAAATLGTLPFSLAYFGRLPLLSLPANLVVVPLVGIAVALGIAFVLFSAVLPPLAPFFASACWGVLWLVEHAAVAAQGLGLRSLHIGYLPVGVVLLIWGVLLSVVLARGRRGRVVALASVLILSNALVWWPLFVPAPELRVIFFDVGLGDAALLRTSSGHTLLVDTGERSEHNDAAARVILPYLERERIGCLDGVLISHGHQDHVGGLPTVLRHVKVGRIFWNGIESEAPGWLAGKKVADSLGIPLRALRAGDTLEVLRPWVVVVLDPDSSFASACGTEDLNDASLVLLVRRDSLALLFTGDVEGPEEKRLLRYGSLLRSSVLKVAHHGSRTSTHASFLAASAPEVAVISASRYNRFGFPAAEVLHRLREMGTRVYLTGEVGAVLVEVKRGKLRVHPWDENAADATAGDRRFLEDNRLAGGVVPR